MKTLKTTILKTKYALLALFVAFSFSCSPEDGAAGPIGPAGADGADGADGNANVQTLTVDTSTLTGTSFNLTVNELTQDVIDNDAILFYLKRSTQYYAIPGISFGDLMEVELGAADLDIYFYNRTDGGTNTIPAGRYTLAKIVIIESSSTTSTTGRTYNSQQQIYNELSQAKVNINDYYAVCDYYGIAY